MRSLLLFLFLSWSARAGTAQRPVAEPPPDYDVKRAVGKIVIDGRLDEAAWKEAGSVTLQFPWSEQTGEKQPTTVRLLWDDQFLYVAYECADHDIVAHHRHRDDPTYEDDAVELFLNPNPKLNTYVGLEMNARAVLYDYLNTFPFSLRKSYDLAGARLAAQLDGTLNNSADRDRGWVLEVAVPLANFTGMMTGQRVAAGSVWRANFNRWDGTEPNRRLSMWSDSGLLKPSPHNPARFGWLHFK